MRIRISIVSILFIIGFQKSASAQKDPIKFVNDHWTLRIDTLQKGNSDNIYLESQFRFQNIGKHLTFIDTNLRKQYLTKPMNYSTILQGYGIGFNNIGGSYFYRNGIKTYTDTLSLPFYYEGKIFRHNIYLSKTFEKNQLVKLSTNEFDVSDRVKEFFVYDKKTDSTFGTSVKFVLYIPIENKNSDTIFCNKELTFYNDTNGETQGTYLKVPIAPKDTYLLPVNCCMDMRTSFNRPCAITINNKDTIEIYHFVVLSKFIPQGNLTYERHPSYN